MRAFRNFPQTCAPSLGSASLRNPTLTDRDPLVVTVQFGALDNRPGSPARDPRTPRVSLAGRPGPFPTHTSEPATGNRSAILRGPDFSRIPFSISRRAYPTDPELSRTVKNLSEDGRADGRATQGDSLRRNGPRRQGKAGGVRGQEAARPFVSGADAAEGGA